MTSLSCNLLSYAVSQIILLVNTSTTSHLVPILVVTNKYYLERTEDLHHRLLLSSGTCVLAFVYRHVAILPILTSLIDGHSGTRVDLRCCIVGVSRILLGNEERMHEPQSSTPTNGIRQCC
ncbi:hypothetical protein BDV38DRAFT_4708 [Aspergillus pseudotamarii]|uniref:Uncharacterized protein n=1 Tax=Aspergillus pseudotamarii TaxID=132259 RepID=A0A5N6TCD3_ASPPS|nr:uncharacterized protein BDV38DRAFT_4708 [Aspergillus pseudotamarii]KAE8143927.1 hypothetical protein BDV38DRAFT_4708 [Aspergillus pseudotamarii]